MFFRVTLKLVRFNNKVNYLNTFIGSRCGNHRGCSIITGGVGGFTGAVDATFDPDVSVVDGFIDGAKGAAIGWGVGKATKNGHLGNQVGATHDVINSMQ